MFSGKAFSSVTRPLFHDANSKRGGVLMHAKVSAWRSHACVPYANGQQVLVGLFEPLDRSLGFVPSPSQPTKRKADEMEDDKVYGIGGWVYMGSHNFSSAAWVSPPGGIQASPRLQTNMPCRVPST